LITKVFQSQQIPLWWADQRGRCKLTGALLGGEILAGIVGQATWLQWRHGEFVNI